MTIYKEFLGTRYERVLVNQKMDKYAKKYTEVVLL